MSYEYEFLVGSLTLPPEADTNEKIVGIQRFVAVNAKQDYRLVFLERLMGSDDFVAIMERQVPLDFKVDIGIPPREDES